MSSTSCVRVCERRAREESTLLNESSFRFMIGRLSVKDGKRAVLGFSHMQGDQQLMLIKTVSDPDPMESLCHGAQVNPPTPTFSALDMAMMSVEIFTVSLNKPLWESHMPTLVDCLDGHVRFDQNKNDFRFCLSTRSSLDFFVECYQHTHPLLSSLSLHRFSIGLI